MIDKIIALRKKLHQNPNLSGDEGATAKLVKDFIKQYYPTRIIDKIGGYGLAAIYEFSSKGPIVMIRCELDALPIEELNTFTHRSKNPGISHKCGHDGHMSIVTGLIFWLAQQSFKYGTIILLFQPAEETGKGAHLMLEDEKFKHIIPDYVFALHNLPGKPMHSIMVKEGTFSASVQSLIIRINGVQAHASEPENGINPTLAITEIAQSLLELNQPNPQSEDFFIITPIHIKVGEKNYGIAPGHGEIHFTLRTWSDEYMQTIESLIKKQVKDIVEKYKLQHSLEWLEYFPATNNHPECTAVVEAAAKINNLQLIDEVSPLRFGEDFGWFSKKYKTAMFGLGAGLHTPALHHNDYDFPDELLVTGMNMFKSIITKLFSSFEE